jgi:hypothetical protein
MSKAAFVVLASIPAVSGRATKRDIPDTLNWNQTAMDTAEWDTQTSQSQAAGSGKVCALGASNCVLDILNPVDQTKFLPPIQTVAVNTLTNDQSMPAAFFNATLKEFRENLAKLSPPSFDATLVKNDAAIQKLTEYLSHSDPGADDTAKPDWTAAPATEWLNQKLYHQAIGQWCYMSTFANIDGSCTAKDVDITKLGALDSDTGLRQSGTDERVLTPEQIAGNCKKSVESRTLAQAQDLLKARWGALDAGDEPTADGFKKDLSLTNLGQVCAHADVGLSNVCLAFISTADMQKSYTLDASTVTLKTGGDTPVDVATFAQKDNTDKAQAVAGVRSVLNFKASFDKMTTDKKKVLDALKTIYDGQTETKWKQDGVEQVCKVLNAEYAACVYKETTTGSYKLSDTAAFAFNNEATVEMSAKFKVGNADDALLLFATFDTAGDDKEIAYKKPEFKTALETAAKVEGDNDEDKVNGRFESLAAIAKKDDQKNAQKAAKKLCKSLSLSEDCKVEGAANGLSALFAVFLAAFLFFL